MSNKSGYIGRNPGDSSVTIARQTFTPTSNTTEFSFTSGYTVGLCHVYLNGVKLIDGTDYEASTGSTVGLTSTATSGDVVEIVAYKAFNLGNVTDANGNFTVGSQLSVGSTATLSGVTTCEGDLYVGGDLYVLDDIVYDEVSGRNIYISGIATVGSATTIDGSGINVTGVITATSFSGDGSSLTGVAATDYVVSNTLKVVGISTFSGEVQVGTAVTIGTAGITTFSKGVHLDGTTVFGKGNAVMLENGFENENAQIVNDGATEKATIVFKTSSGGTVSERLRIKDTGDVDLSGSAAGVSSVTWDASANSLIFNDDSKAVFGTGSDLQIYHSANNWNYITSPTSRNLSINPVTSEAGIQVLANSSVHLFFDGSEKIKTTPTGVVVTGMTTSTTGIHAGPGILRENFRGYGSAMNGAYNADVLSTGMVLNAPTNSTATFSINVRGNGSTTFNSLLNAGESAVFTAFVGQNNASYYLTDFQIDGSSITEEWAGGTAPSAGGASGTDVYTFTILKTADATFSVFANLTNFA